MKRIRSLANKPRLDKHEKPNNARVKKNMPDPGVNPQVNQRTYRLTQPILEARDIVAGQHNRMKKATGKGQAALT